jgi:hypothetical protein
MAVIFLSNTNWYKPFEATCRATLILNNSKNEERSFLEIMACSIRKQE